MNGKVKRMLERWRETVPYWKRPSLQELKEQWEQTDHVMRGKIRKQMEKDIKNGEASVE